MGFVFSFLTLLVISTKAMSATVMRFAPIEEIMVSPSQQVANDAQLMAVLSAAVHRYREDKS